VANERIGTEGALCEFVRVKANWVEKKPQNIDWADESGIACAALTAWQMLFRQAHVNGGGHIFVNGGTTPVGMYVIQFAKSR
jgi:NADPH:quinone reductase-like Zn-dependent oxidoreductase